MSLPKPRIPHPVVQVLLFVGVLLVYLRTMSPGIGTEDPGELAAVLHTMGIAHPTGYPLFTMLGSLFVRLPFGEYGAWRMNLFGAVLTATAAVLFLGLLRFVFSERGLRLFTSSKHSVPSRSTTFFSNAEVAAVSTTLLFAFSAVFWQEAVFIEVYALHLVFLAVVSRLFLLALERFQIGAASTAPRGRWILFAYVLGLSFSHHGMTVLLAPAFLWLFFRVLGFNKTSLGLIGAAVLPFLLGLSLYLYLPIRSAAAPVMNWGDPSNVSALWKHITAAQYGEQMFSSWDIAMRKLAQFTVDLPSDFGWPALVFAVVGMGVLWRQAAGLLVFSLLVFATGLFYAINYTFDDPNFHLHSHFMVALWAGAALGALWNAGRGSWMIPVRVVCGLAALSPLVLNYGRMDKSEDTLVSDYSRTVLESMDTGAVLFTNEYERLGSPAFYWQIVKGYRTDAAVLDIILLGNPWYYPHLEARHPWLMEASRPEITAYREELTRFINNSKDTVTYNARLRAMFKSLIERSREAGRPVYFTSGINASEAPGYRLVPSGMVFRLEPEGGPTVFIPPKNFLHAPIPPMKVNKLSEQIRVEYAEGYANQGAHLLEHADSAGAAERFRKALAMYPEFPAVRELLNSVTHAR